MHNAAGDGDRCLDFVQGVAGALQRHGDCPAVAAHVPAADDGVPLPEEGCADRRSGVHVASIRKDGLRLAQTKAMNIRVTVPLLAVVWRDYITQERTCTFVFFL